MIRKVVEYFSRKFVLAFLSLGGSFALVWYDKDVLGWSAAIATILGFYNGSNVFQTYVEAKHNAGRGKESTNESKSSPLD